MDTLLLDPAPLAGDDDPVPDPLDIVPDPCGEPDDAFQGDPTVRAWM